MRLPAEWEKQSGVMLTWPDESTPWDELEKVIECYTRVASEIIRFEKLLIVSPDPDAAKLKLALTAARCGIRIDIEKIRFACAPINDTWSRDHAGVAVHGDNGEKYIYDFVFNGWGLKFAADKDNQITKKIFFDGNFKEDVMCVDMRPFVLEGGSIDCDGAGTLLTTTSCLCSVNRNEYLTKEEIEGELKQAFGLSRVLWLDNGAIQGDDTDSHVDILARFASKDTIVYSYCSNPEDCNYKELKAMEEQLKSFRTLDGKEYNLLPLPIPNPLYLDGYRLPGSYSNFLIINGAVLVPGDGSERDDLAKVQLQRAFPDREVIMIDCRALLSGHGGLHCITMNYPEGWL